MRSCYLPSLMYVFSWVRVGFAPNAYPGSTSEFIANSHAFYRTLKMASIMTALVAVINLQPFYSVNNKIFEEETFMIYWVHYVGKGFKENFLIM